MSGLSFTLFVVGIVLVLSAKCINSDTQFRSEMIAHRPLEVSFPYRLLLLLIQFAFAITCFVLAGIHWRAP